MHLYWVMMWRIITASAAYPTDFVSTSVPTGDLFAADNLLKFTVDPGDFPQGSTLESSLRPEFAVLGSGTYRSRTGGNRTVGGRWDDTTGLEAKTD